MFSSLFFSNLQVTTLSAQSVCLFPLCRQNTTSTRQSNFKAANTSQTRTLPILLRLRITRCRDRSCEIIKCATSASVQYAKWLATAAKKEMSKAPLFDVSVLKQIIFLLGKTIILSNCMCGDKKIARNEE